MYAGAYLGPFGGGVTVAMLPELGAAYGVGSGDAAVSVTAYSLPFAALMLVSGTWGARWGRRRTVVVAYVVYAVASLACLLAPTWELFLAARALQGAANSFTTPLVMAALAAATDPGRLGRALGWFGSLQSAGQTSAPLIGGLAAELDWRLAFAGVAVVALGLAVVGIPAAGTTEPGRPTLRSALRPEVLRIGIAVAVGWGWMAGLAFLVALRLEDSFGLDAGARGLVLTGIGVAGLVCAPLVGRGVDRIGPRRTILLGAALGTLVLAGVGLAPTVWMVAAIWALGGPAGQLVLVGTNAMVLGAGRANAGGATSVVQAVRFGGSSVAPVLFTPIYHVDPLAAFLAPAAALAVLVPLAVPRGGVAGRPADR
nr:MFS transporter [Pseudonocardia lacus]